MNETNLYLKLIECADIISLLGDKTFAHDAMQILYVLLLERFPKKDDGVDFDFLQPIKTDDKEQNYDPWL